MACRHCEHLGREGYEETSAKWAVISDDNHEPNIMLTVGGVSRLLSEVICLGVAGTVETGRRFGGSEYTSTDG